MVDAHLCLQGTFTVLGFINSPAEQSLQMCAKICANFKSCVWDVWAALWCVVVRERRNSGQRNPSSIGNYSLSLCICGAPGECVFEIQTGVMALPQKLDTLLYSWQHKARAKVPVQPTVATLCSEVSEEHACLPSASCSVSPLLASSHLQI